MYILFKQEAPPRWDNIRLVANSKEGLTEKICFQHRWQIFVLNDRNDYFSFNVKENISMTNDLISFLLNKITIHKSSHFKFMLSFFKFALQSKIENSVLLTLLIYTVISINNIFNLPKA
jgi:hypothetical protein